MMAKRFLKFIATDKNIYEVLQVLTFLSFQGEKGDSGANVSGLKIQNNKVIFMRLQLQSVFLPSQGKDGSKGEPGPPGLPGKQVLVTSEVRIIACVVCKADFQF